MQKGNILMLEEMAANLRLGISMAARTHCAHNWRDIDYMPDYNKFYYILDGEGWLKIGEREYRPKPGQIFLMPAGVIQSYSTVSSRPFTKYWCHFTARVGDINLFDILDVPFFMDVIDPDGMAGLFEKLIDAQNGEGLANGFTSRAALLEIIARYLAAACGGEPRLRHVSPLSRLNAALAHIQTHIGGDISTAELARTLHYHPNYFTRMFRKYTGLAPTQYINKARLEKAKVLLKTTDMQVSEVAAAAGFGDVYYFSKSFKKHTGFSPTDYRAI